MPARGPSPRTAPCPRRPAGTPRRSAPGPPAAMPGPVSVTETRTSPSTRAAATSTVPPAGVNFTAFESRLKITCTIRRSSPMTVSTSGLRRQRHVDASPGRPLAHDHDPALERLGQREGRDLEIDLAGLDLREVEDVVDQRQQVACRAEDVVEVLGLLLVDLAEQLLAQHLREAADRVQRRPQLVRHVGQELRLVATGGLELAGLLVQLGQRRWPARGSAPGPAARARHRTPGAGQPSG